MILASVFRRTSLQIANNIKMIHYDRIDVSEGIDINKAGASKE